MSKSWPTFTVLHAVELSKPLGHQTEPCFSTLEKKTPDGRIEGKKRKDSTERLGKPPKRSKSSGSPTPGPSHILIRENTRTSGLLIVPEKTSSESWIFKKSSKRKTSSNEPEGPSSKRSRTSSPGEGPSQVRSQTPSSTDSIDDFLAKYQELDMLGQGGFATVLSGLRIKDNFPVAIKYVPQYRVKRTPMVLNGKSSDVPLEVALLIKVGAGPDSMESNVSPLLLDWYDLEDELIMIFEKPEDCMDLKKFLDASDDPLSEAYVKAIMRQLVDTAIEMHYKGVFHRDIKPQNIVIETSSNEPRVRYIDFGCGVTFTPGQKFKRKAGTRNYTSPEWFMCGFCAPEYTTVWQLGVVMYELFHKNLPFDCTYKIVNQNPPILVDISNKCRNFLNGCLMKCYKDRFTLENLKNHPWLK